MYAYRVMYMPIHLYAIPSIVLCITLVFLNVW